MSLKDIYSQDRALHRLQSACAAGRTAHAYIFAGPDGVGKQKTACEWSKLLLCSNPTTENSFSDSCGRCTSCEKFDAGAHPDFNLVYKELRQFTRDGKGKTTPIDMPIDVIREFLIEKIASKPSLSQRRIFVVCEAEKLNASSQNALLKVLEEPPAFCHIILVCTRLDKLLPTTRSRCQAIRFGQIDEEKIIEKLNTLGLQGMQAKYFARLSAGSIGKGCDLARLELEGAELYKTKTAIVNSLASLTEPDAVNIAAETISYVKNITECWSGLEKETSKSDIHRRADRIVIAMIISAFSDAMKLAVNGGAVITNFDQEKTVSRLAERFTAEKLAANIDACYKASDRIDASVNETLTFEDLLLTCADSDTMVTLD